MALVENYKGYEIHDDRTGGDQDAQGDLVGKTVNYAYKGPTSSLPVFISIRDAKQRIDKDIDRQKSMGQG